ncbi:alanine racemase [Spirochaeta isovalerica]|uniref:Alanine racemase n=1 Tax=Spirochaeta isovalerica TaxID=150 RepID=A0A841RIU2_9SPIO|nr:alanine racemase [Spirochaeta isovalerica]MBB6482438.1 alanine racemase [Spirochaeta isovalerica]
MNENRRATRARIYLKNIDHNLDCIRKLIGPERKICTAVKADAYGHGAVEVSKRALEWGVDFLAVATVSEAIILREAGIEAPIILFSIAMDREIEQIVSYNLTPFVADPVYTNRIHEEAVRQKKTINVHLKIDTGMGRIGVQPDEAVDLAGTIVRSAGMRLEGVCTHFPVSDSPEREDIDFTREQIRIFNQAVESIRKRGIDPGIVHAANSGAIIAHPDAHFDMVRPGICLYGYYPDQRMDKSPADFKPVMELISRPAFIKKVKRGTSISYGRTWKAPADTWIASLPAGYADGYNRLLSSKAEVSIGGKRFPVAGRVCMDQFMIDLGPETDITVNVEVILFGPGQGSPDAAEIGGMTGTIPYEVTCAINKRVPRDYV